MSISAVSHIAAIFAGSIILYLQFVTSNDDKALGFTLIVQYDSLV
jgi:hypothetical protein